MVTLDVGCGPTKKGDIGVDLRKLPGVDVVCDVHYLPFADEVFDVVRSSLVIEHTLNPFQFVLEQVRVLTKHGVLYCKADNARYWRFHIKASPFEQDFVNHFRSTEYDASEEHNMIFYPECVTKLFRKAELKNIKLQYTSPQKKLDRMINFLVPVFQENMCCMFEVAGKKC